MKKSILLLLSLFFFTTMVVAQNKQIKVDKSKIKTTNDSGIKTDGVVQKVNQFTFNKKTYKIKEATSTSVSEHWSITFVTETGETLTVSIDPEGVEFLEHKLIDGKYTPSVGADFRTSENSDGVQLNGYYETKSSGEGDATEYNIVMVFRDEKKAPFNLTFKGKIQYVEYTGED